MPVEDPLCCRLDHLVICASDLSQGVTWFEKLSGISMPFGGEHPLMATHNHLSALSSNTFLEIIAANPVASAAARKRWFALDDPAFQERLRNGPALATWVVYTRDLRSALMAASDAGIDAGKPVKLTRGDLQWEIGLRDDGSLAYDGAFPILIQWPEGVNPVSRMQNQGMQLSSLQLQHPDAESLRVALAALGIGELAQVQAGPAGLHARMRINGRPFTLSS